MKIKVNMPLSACAAARRWLLWPSILFYRDERIARPFWRGGRRDAVAAHDSEIGEPLAAMRLAAIAVLGIKG